METAISYRGKIGVIGYIEFVGFRVCRGSPIDLNILRSSSSGLPTRNPYF